MILILLCLIVTVLWYVKFKYTRRRLYELAEKIPEFKGYAVPYLGYLGYSYDIENMMVPFIESNSRFCFDNGGCAKMWVGPMLFVALTNLEDTKYIMKYYLEKDLLLTRHLRSVTGNAGVFAPVQAWRRRRKVLVPAFSPKILNSFMDVLVKRATELVDNLEQFVDSDSFDIWPFLNEYTLLSVAETSLGVKIDEMDHKAQEELLYTFQELFKLTTYRLLHVWLWPDLAYNLTLQSFTFRKHRKMLRNFIDKIINMKRKELQSVDINTYEKQTVFGQDNGGVKTFLDHLILLSKQSKGFTNTELKEELTTFLLAGTDTSAVAICNTLLLLSKYPKIQDKVYEEIERVLGDSDTVLDKDHLTDMTYLEMVLKESLRLLPPVPVIVRKTKEEIELSSGVIIPKSTCTLVSIWGINRDPKHWGPDAECFNPDRFLSGGKTGLFMTFSTGPRNCVGFRYAIISAKIAIATILRRYVVVGEEAAGPNPNIKCNFAIMMKVADGYHVKLKRRC